ncbi:TIR-NBS-LRR disease resistance protein [Quillaja saponaria]|uniref:TIR-NBS-LRR disease resistance protein n=1 Tax=Quillaja saponaria TaxID=32244 RepID=A0AAD7LS21_QUISA|nr:TIR-NBS-LRR disease resistance protein [Quillaja saponaria]
MRSLKKLELYGCESLEEFSVSPKISEIPNDVMICLLSLKYLILSFTNIQSIPASIKNISHLRSLDVRHCERLESLPQLPSSLRQLDASGCTQLETITSFSLGMITPYWKEYTNNGKYNSCIEKLLFSHCTKLDQKTLKNIEVQAKLSVHRVAYLYSRKILEGVIFKGSDHPEVQICFPGTEIPEWFRYRTTGSSITIEFHLAILNNPNFLGFTLCSVTTGSVLVQCKVYFGKHLVQTEYCGDASCADCSNSNDQVWMSYQRGFNSQLVEKLKESFILGTISQLVMITFRFEPHTCIKENGVSMVCATCSKKNGASRVRVQDQDCLPQGIGTKRRRAESGQSKSEICMIDKEEWW